jgi:hypothetical protein
MNRKLLLAASAAIIMQLSTGFASNPLVEQAESSSLRTSVPAAVVQDIVPAGLIPSSAVALVPQAEEDATAPKDFAITPANLVNELLESDAAIKQSKLALIVAGAAKSTYEQVKDYDQNGSKYVGNAVKAYVENKLPGGKAITTVTSVIAGQLKPGANSLTEIALDAVRAPLKLEKKDYPDRRAGIVGHKLQKAVALLPYGTQAVAGVRTLAKKYGRDTLSEVVADHLFRAAPEAAAAIEAPEVAALPSPKPDSQVEKE